MRDTVSIEVEDTIAATSQALLCVIEGELFWIPLSVIDTESEVMDKGDRGTLIVARWFARKEGFEP